MAKYPPEPLTEAEVWALMRQCSARAPTGIRNRAMITVMYRGGLRLDETLALKPADVDPAAGTIRVLHGKGDKARVIGLDDGALAIIQRWMDKRGELGLRNGRCTCQRPKRTADGPTYFPANPSCTAHLFCTLAGHPVTDRYVRNMLKRAAAKAGITKRVHPHGLRHSHAVDLSTSGVPVKTIQHQLGHDHLTTTAIYLDHVAPADVIAMGRSRKPWTES